MAMCDECWSWLHDSLPVCERCVAELRSGPPSRWPFAAAFGAFALAIAFVGLRLDKTSLELWIPIAVIGVICALVIGFTSPTKDGPEPNIVGRTADDAPTPEALQRAAHPYRARIARVTRRALPLSGKSTALLLSLALVVSAVLVPVSLRLPRWIELELVLAAWWLAVCALLVVLLYRGFRLVDDHQFRIRAFGNSTTNERDWSSLSGCGDASGCIEGVVVVVALLIAAAAAWLLVEIVVPVVFLLVYYFTVKAIGRVARDRHECQGNLARSLGWGAAFASVCVAPIAFLVWVVQTILALKHGS